MKLWLLGEVTFRKDDQGTAADIVLMPPAAFSVEPYRFYSKIFAGANLLMDYRRIYQQLKNATLGIESRHLE
ncbi:hypothetical protein [Pantoea stewartii]|uniref:hypothetical protein n=1 Tax=Pantoea stewartii TaxID=66269 RepID=UPI003DA711F2